MVILSYTNATKKMKLYVQVMQGKFYPKPLSFH